MFGAVRNRADCQRCANVGRFGAALLLRGLEIRCDRSHWHGCAQQGIDVRTLLLCEAVAGG